MNYNTERAILAGIVGGASAALAYIGTKDVTASVAIGAVLSGLVAGVETFEQQEAPPVAGAT